MSVAALAPAPESVFEIGKRLTELLMQAEADSDGDGLPDSAQERIANLVEALRTRVVRSAERDLRSLFDLDEELIELMDRVEDATADGGEVPAELLQEVNDYLEAFRTKVDRIAGCWRWQESIADICSKEAERLEARRKAAAGRLERLKGMNKKPSPRRTREGFHQCIRNKILSRAAARQGRVLLHGEKKGRLPYVERAA
jgi:hypothetical protein